jgi:RNA polymerase sigma-70 factor (ECF subfamily)
MLFDYTTAPDEKLIQEVVRGYIHAYGELYKRYRDDVYQYIYFRYVEKSEVEELTQQVFIKSWEVITNSWGTKQNFRALCFQVAHNLMMDHWSEKNPEALVRENRLLQEITIPPEEMVAVNDETRALVENIRILDTILQEVIICRFIIELSLAETAHALGLSEDQVRGLQYHALQKIQVGEE